ncbi:MAG: hypothetical protein L6435_00680 [Anaerolineae bacterium]|nr:hypothetical protein [Anaerolineae bacterium]
MSNEEISRLMHRAAERAAVNSFFLAADFAYYQKAQGISDVELAEFLSIEIEMLPKLALCRRPDPESPEFRSDVQSIEQSFSLQTNHLVQLLREVEALRTLSEFQPATSEQMKQKGLLMAARDSEDHKEDGKPTNRNSNPSTDCDGGGA